MVITKVSRTYSRSLNSANYGGKESWIRIEATYEAKIESGDDPLNVSKMLEAQAQKDVAEQVAGTIAKIKEAAAPKAPAAPAAGAPRPL